MKTYCLILLSLLLLVSCTNNGKTLIINADRVDGLTSKALITINGFEIGKVSNLSLAKDGTINIECKLDTEPNIPIDSKFSIEQPNPLVNKEITLELGTSDQFVQHGDTLKLFAKPLKNNLDSLKTVVGDLFEHFTGAKKRDSILLELQKLNKQLEKLEEDK